MFSAMATDPVSGRSTTAWSSSPFVPPAESTQPAVMWSEFRSNLETHLRPNFLLLIHHQLTVGREKQFEVHQRPGRWPGHDRT